MSAVRSLFRSNQQGARRRDGRPARRGHDELRVPVLWPPVLEAYADGDLARIQVAIAQATQEVELQPGIKRSGAGIGRTSCRRSGGSATSRSASLAGVRNQDCADLYDKSLALAGMTTRTGTASHRSVQWADQHDFEVCCTIEEPLNVRQRHFRAPRHVE